MVCSTALVGSWLLTVQDSLSVPSSRFKRSNPWSRYR